MIPPLVILLHSVGQCACSSSYSSIQGEVRDDPYLQTRFTLIKDILNCAIIVAYTCLHKHSLYVSISYIAEPENNEADTLHNYILE